MRHVWCICTLLTISLVILQAQEPAPSSEKVRQSIDRAMKFLAQKQNKNHHWETSTPVQLGDYAGGSTALVCLALLEAGSKPEEAPLKEGLAYLRQMNMKKTYCQGLRMAALSHLIRNHPKHSTEADKKLLAADRKQLIDNLCRDQAGKLIGWSYPIANVPRADFSNSHYAILGLEAAQLAGVETSKELWQEVRDLYQRTQGGQGGWGYTADTASDRLSMTLAGIIGLSYSAQQLQEQPVQQSIDKAYQLVGRRLKPNFLHLPGSNNFPFYTLFALSRANALTKVKELKPTDGKEFKMYDELSASLVQLQAAEGSWGSAAGFIDNNDVLATSFAVIFLARGQAK